MGTCYKLILWDEWDWGWKNTSKEKQLKEFEEKFRQERFIERITEWHHFVVYDIDKASPFVEKRKELIRQYCDRAYYTADESAIRELELPQRKTVIQEQIDSSIRAKEIREKLKYGKSKDV
jgi:hypothetical protein